VTMRRRRRRRKKKRLLLDDHLLENLLLKCREELRRRRNRRVVACLRRNRCLARRHLRPSRDPVDLRESGEPHPRESQRRVQHLHPVVMFLAVPPPEVAHETILDSRNLRKCSKCTFRCPRSCPRCARAVSRMQRFRHSRAADLRPRRRPLVRWEARNRRWAVVYSLQFSKERN